MSRLSGSISLNDRFQYVLSLATLIALLGSLCVPGTVSSLTLAPTSPSIRQFQEDIPPQVDGGTHVEQATTLVKDIAPGDAEEATPLQQAIMESIEERNAAGMPVPSSASYEYEVVPSLSIASLVEASTSPIKEFKLVYRTELHFDSPEQAGQEKWPDLVVEEKMPPNATGFVNAGDYTQSVRDAAERAQPGIWEQYEFGQEPRTFIFEEAFEVFSSEESSAAPRVMSANPATAGDILFGFTNSVWYNLPLKISSEIGDTGIEVWSNVLLTYGWDAGLRLPVTVTLEAPVATMLPGQDYMLTTSITAANWTKEQYAGKGVLPFDGKELVLDAGILVQAAAGIKGTNLDLPLFAFEYPVIDFDIGDYEFKVGENEHCRVPQDFYTPFDNIRYPPPNPDCPFLVTENGGIQFDFSPELTGLYFDVILSEFFGIDIDLGTGFIVNYGLGSTSIEADWQAAGNAFGDGKNIEYSTNGGVVKIGPITTHDTARGDGIPQNASVVLMNFRYNPSLLFNLSGYLCVKGKVFGIPIKCDDVNTRKNPTPIYGSDLKLDPLSIHPETQDSVGLEIPMTSPILISKTADETVASIGDTVTITTTVINDWETPLTDVTITDNGVNVLDDCPDVARTRVLGVGESCTYTPRTFTATEDKDIASTTVVTATLIHNDMPVQVRSTASKFVPVLNGVVGSGAQESCTEDSLDAELYDYTGDTMTFNCGSEDATMVISTTKTISRDITIIGSNTSIITIDGGGSNDPPDDAVRVFYVEEGATLNLQNLVVAHGRVHRELAPVSLEPGGGIYNLGTVNLQNVTITGNEADQGGGIHNSGTLNIVQSELSDNTAKLEVSGDDKTWDGGAIYNDGRLTITGSIIENNTANGGGGLLNWGNVEVYISNSVIASNHATNGGGIENGGGGSVTIRDTEIHDNRADWIGGGIANFETSRVEITDCVIAGNHATNGGGIENDVGGSVIIRDTEIRDNRADWIGGGIDNLKTSRIVISNSSLTGNIATQAGGIQNKGILGIQVDINNSDAILPGTTLLSGNQAVSLEEEATLDGGAIYNDGTLKIANSTIERNAARGGGGIINWGGGTLEITDTAIAENTAVNGGGIENGENGVVFLTDTQVHNNEAIFIGGGICNFETGLVVISSSSLMGNTGAQGGGIQNKGLLGIQVDVANNDSIIAGTTMISANSVPNDGGGIYNDGTLKIAHSTIERNIARGGGGILNWIDSQAGLVGTIEVINSTIANNWAGNGGGIENGCPDGSNECGAIVLRNSTLFNNRAIYRGGAIANYSSGNVIVENSTIASNTAPAGGGINTSVFGSIEIGQSLIANNQGNNCVETARSNGEDEFRNCVEAVTSSGYNLDSDNTFGFDNTNNLVDIDPLLASPTDNGGPTITMALSPDSPALDYVPADACTVATDQRGEGYPRPVDGNSDGVAECDIGAFELTPPTSAHITVTSNANSGPGSLRWALAGLKPGGTIDFAFARPTTIELASELVIDKAVTIDGPGIHELTISGSDETRVFKVMDWGTMNIQGLTVADGKIHQPSNASGLVEPGGGIFNLGEVNIQNAVLTRNEADQGGAIHNSGILTIASSVIADNVAGYASGGGDGGGIYNDGELIMHNAAVIGNHAYGGGGILNWGTGKVELGTVEVSGNFASNGGGVENGDQGIVIIENNSTIAQNSATFIGGGIVNYDAGKVTINNSTVASNTADNGGGIYNLANDSVDISRSKIVENLAEHNGGGIWNSGTLSITQSTFSGNKAKSGGGGLVNTGNGEVTIHTSTFTGNSAGYGGGIQNGGDDGKLTIINTTISGNSAYPFSGAPGGGGIGGGLRNIEGGIVVVTNSTISGNSATESGGGIHNLGDVPVEIDQCILANNQGINCIGLVTSSGYNLESGETCGFDETGDLSSTDPLLGPLQDNGGPSLTHALLPGSPAIDKIPLHQCKIAIDQRGVSRPQGHMCDIGAFEAITLNNPPTASANGPYTVDEGSIATLDASSSSDPDGDPLTYEWDLDNDGEFIDAVGVTAEASFPDDGGYPIAVRVTDPSGAQATDSATVNVLNVSPTIPNPINTTGKPALINTNIEFSASFTDPGTHDTHTALWDWGDGTTSPGLVDAYNVTGSHAYKKAGFYTVTLSITDDDGGSAARSYQYVVVFDPKAGFVTGGGWINSPIGAYTPDPTLTGKATFGFVSKYQKGANFPTGNTEFQFHVAGMNFKSTSYDWLVIAGSKAQYKGNGTINGTGDYKFILAAIDGTPDKFRIKIWDKATGEIVYDNMLGAEDTADPATVIQGGSIVIHKAK